MSVIVRLDVDGEAKYIEWSTVVDAPTMTFAVPRDRFVAWYRREYAHEEGERVMCELPARLARADGPRRTSSMVPGEDLAALVGTNRAGPGESQLTLAEIIDKYGRHA